MSNPITSLEITKSSSSHLALASPGMYHHSRSRAVTQSAGVLFAAPPEPISARLEVALALAAHSWVGAGCLDWWLGSCEGSPGACGGSGGLWRRDWFKGTKLVVRAPLRTALIALAAAAEAVPARLEVSCASGADSLVALHGRLIRLTLRV